MSVCHGTDYATQDGTGNNTGRHFSCRGMTSIHRTRVVHMYGNWFAEEIVGIIVAVVIPPGTVYIVTPASVMVIAYTALPTRHITSATDTGRGTFHKAASARNEMPVVPANVLGGMRHTLRAPVPFGLLAIVIAIIVATYLSTFYTLMVASAPLSLSIGFQTWHKHCHR